MEKMNNNIVDLALSVKTKDKKLNPDFVTGLTEAEGCFSIIKHKDNRAKNKIGIGLRFKLTMLINEIELLEDLKFFLIVD